MLAALGWCALNQMAEAPAARCISGSFDPARNAPVMTFLLSFGPILFRWRSAYGRRGQSARALGASIVGIGLSVFLMFFLTLTVDLFWVGFRTGQIFFVFVPGDRRSGVCRLAWPARQPVLAVGLGAPHVLAIGFPTTVIDAYNTQDVANLGDGARVSLDMRITPAEQEAFAWINGTPPLTPSCRPEPIDAGARDVEPDSHLRRTAHGGREPDLSARRPGYAEESEQVRQIYAGPDADAAWQQAKRLGIDYLYRRHAGAPPIRRSAKFDAHPDLFAPAFHNAERRVYRDQVDAPKIRAGTAHCFQR